mgnify:FL=1
MSKHFKDITAYEYAQYEVCRESGVTNMFDVTNVMNITGLDKQTIMDIISNYDYLRAKYSKSVSK